MEHPSEEFRVAVVDADAGATLKWGGEVDSSCADQLAARLDASIDASVGVVTVDLSQVTFLDASGLRTLAAAHQRLQADGRRLAVRRPSAKLSRARAERDGRRPRCASASSPFKPSTRPSAASNGLGAEGI